jgi:DNA-binding MarR family transcriptional regulator
MSAAKAARGAPIPPDMMHICGVMDRCADVVGATTSERRSMRLSAALRRTSNIIQRRLEQHGQQSGLLSRRANVLIALMGFEPNSVPLNVLAETLDVTQGNLSAMISAMTKERLITSVSDPTDGRSILVSLTRKGRALIERYVPSYYDVLTSLTDGLTDAEKDQLVQLLDKARLGARAGKMPTSSVPQ